MKTLKTRPNWQIDLVGVTVTLVIIGLATWFGFKPLVDHRLELAEQTQDLRQQRDEVRTLTETSHQLTTQLVRVERAIEQSELRLEPLRSLNRRVAALTELAGEHGLDLAEIQPGGAVSGQRYEKVPVHLAGQADYTDCARFLNALSEHFPDVTLSAMELQATVAQQRRVAQFRFTLTWHAAPTMTAEVTGGRR